MSITVITFPNGGFGIFCKRRTSFQVATSGNYFWPIFLVFWFHTFRPSLHVKNTRTHTSSKVDCKNEWKKMEWNLHSPVAIMHSAVQAQRPIIFPVLLSWKRSITLDQSLANRQSLTRPNKNTRCFQCNLTCILDHKLSFFHAHNRPLQIAESYFATLEIRVFILQKTIFCFFNRQKKLNQLILLRRD